MHPVRMRTATAAAPLRLTTYTVKLHTKGWLKVAAYIANSIFNGLLKEVELGIELSSTRTGDILFANDFVGVCDSGEQLQKLIDVVHAYCCKWRLTANVSKSAVVVFARDVVEGAWKWGENNLPNVCKYTYLGIDFQCNGAWDMHIKRVAENERK